MPRLHKQPYHERRLVDFAEQVVGLPYVWGHTDCASIALRAIQVLSKATDADLLQRLGLESWYDSRTSALRTFSQLEGIRSALLSLGMTEHPPRYAHQGDILVLPGADGHPVESAGVVVSGRMLTSVEEQGVYWCLIDTRPVVVAMRL